MFQFEFSLRGNREPGDGENFSQLQFIRNENIQLISPLIRLPTKWMQRADA